MGSSQCQKKKLTDSKSEKLQDKLRQKYKKANKQKKLVRAGRRFYADNLAAQAEEAAAKEELGQIYKIIKLVCNNFRIKLDLPIKDKSGKLLTTERAKKALS